MAQTIRVSKEMRFIIEYYKKELESKGFNISKSLTDAGIVESLLHTWLVQNNDPRHVDEILNSLYD